MAYCLIDVKHALNVLCVQRLPLHYDQLFQLFQNEKKQLHVHYELQLEQYVKTLHGFRVNHQQEELLLLEYL